MAQRPSELTKQVTAGAKYIRMSPYKVREVALLIRGKPIDEARRILAFTPKAACREISKVLESAIANAEHNFQIPQEELYVKLASADEGVTIKRFRPRAQGRGFRIRKRTSHINLTLERLPESLIESAVQPARRASRGKPKQTTSAGGKTPSSRGQSKAPKSESDKGAKAVGKGAKTPEATKPPAQADSQTTSEEEGK